MKGYLIGVLLGATCMVPFVGLLGTGHASSTAAPACESRIIRTVVPCSVDRVIDGDTVSVTCELLAGDTYRKFAVRPPNVDAAERYTDEGRKATAWTKQWVAAKGGRVLFGDHGPGKYAGRRLGDLYPADGGASWSADLRAAGFDLLTRESLPQ